MDDGSLVLDVGSSSVKCGWSGEDTPRVNVPSVVTSLKAKDAQKARQLRRLACLEGGVETILLDREDVDVQHVVKRGQVANWENMEKLLEGVFAVELDAMGGSDSLSVPVSWRRGVLGVCWCSCYPSLSAVCYSLRRNIPLTPPSLSLTTQILVAESPNTSKVDREKLTQMLFETFKVSGVAFANSAVLSLFASGRTRGMLLECGAGVSHAVPVFEGFSLPHAVLKLDAGGQDVTGYLQNNFKRQMGYQSIRDMKHEVRDGRRVGAE